MLISHWTLRGWRTIPILFCICYNCCSNVTRDNSLEALHQHREADQVTNGEWVARIKGLEQRRAELRARLPRHTPPTAMLVELDEIEDELARLSDGDKHSNWPLQG